MASINTNYGAAIALQNLNKTNSELERTQNRINTGMKVATAKDSGAIFAIATSQRANAASQDAVRANLQRSQSITDVALAAGDTITTALEEMKSLAVSIQSSVVGSSAETSYLAEYNALGLEITNAISGASFDGVNSLTTPLGAAGVTAVSGGGKARAAATTTAVDTAISTVTAALSTLGTESKSLGRQITFVNKLQDALEAGVGNLVDADLAKESAKLTALQTKQQLGVQALSIANQGSSILLSLFR
jgi:flagellin